MKVFWVAANPEPRSLGGSLKDFGLNVLKKAGHEVELSDLYAMKWKAVAGPDDFPSRDPRERLEYMVASRAAYDSGEQAGDIAAEQQKLLWADAVIFQFPLWWYSMPGIMKGWVDRVFANGFAYGLPDPKWPGRTQRYGDGLLEGRKVMIIVSTAAGEVALGPRGISGGVDDILFHINHGMIWYAGMQPLPPFVVYGATRTNSDRYGELESLLEQRLLTLDSTPPIPYRKQNSGDYDDNLALKPGLECASAGLGIHLREPDEIAQA